MNRTEAPARPRVLIVEDEATTASTIALYLRHDGIDPVVVHDGRAGLQRARAGGFDLIILDLMLPGLDGMQICRELREASDIPVIMVTARTTEQNRIEGLEAGADDYVSKPFSPRELVARIRANLRRVPASRPPSAEPITHADLHIDREQRQVMMAGEAVELTHLEFELLALMASRPGRLWTREALIDSVFGGETGPNDRTIDAHIKNLRRKIEPDRKHPRWIRTVFGSGYRFTPPAETE